MNSEANPERLSASLVRDLILPTILFAALGGMTWAVRGCSGYGAVAGCWFAGVTWGAAWWFISRERSWQQPRRYASGWIILALAVGIGVSGNRGWMQWPSFFEGRLQTDSPHGGFVPIAREYGFLWMFIAGVPWAGIGACLLAWCASGSKVSMKGWVARLACAFGCAYVGSQLVRLFPELFLPMYKTMGARYADLGANPNLRRLMNDNVAALTHLGFYLGCLLFEILRRDWRNALLIGTVGLVNGIGWAALQNWTWARVFWPKADFNFWRCWESSGGISIGIAYGLAYYLVNRPAVVREEVPVCPNTERFGVYAGLILGLGFSVRSGLKGWANIYIGNEDYWSAVLWKILGPLMLVGLAAVLLRIRRCPTPSSFRGDLFPHDSRLIWVVLATQNVLAQLITGPLSSWNEVAFSIYYVLLFAISGVVVYHYQSAKERAQFAL